MATETATAQNSDALPTQTRWVVLASRPQGAPTDEDFRIETVDLPELADGQILVRNDVMSVDPYMRGRMNDAKSYVAPYEVDQPMDGGAVGTVLASRAEGIEPGQHVVHGLGWREHAVVDGKAARVVDTEGVPDSAYLSVLGMTGVTAYVGIKGVAQLQPGETVFVSGAAGAVGSAVVQLAKLLGAGRVIGSAGSAEKVARVEEFGADVAFNYKDAPVAEQLEKAAPDGVDVYFDNVGGDHLDAAIASFNPHGRGALCGAISQYNSTETAGIKDPTQIVKKKLRLEGFIQGDHPDWAKEYHEQAPAWLKEGKLQYDETVREGLDDAPRAFMDMLDGANTGKMIVRL